jgi:hypothetical protein
VTTRWLLLDLRAKTINAAISENPMASVMKWADEKGWNGMVDF